MSRRPLQVLLVLVLAASSITSSSAAQHTRGSRALLEDAPQQQPEDTTAAAGDTPSARDVSADAVNLPFLEGAKVDGALYTNGGGQDGLNLWSPSTPSFLPVPGSGNAATGSASRIPIRNDWTELAAATLTRTAGGNFRTVVAADLTTSGFLELSVQLQNTTLFNYTLVPNLSAAFAASTATLRSSRIAGCSLVPQGSSFPVAIAADIWPDTGAITLSAAAFVLSGFTFPYTVSAEYQLSCPCVSSSGTLQRRGTPCARPRQFPCELPMCDGISQQCLGTGLRPDGAACSWYDKAAPDGWVAAHMGDESASSLSHATVDEARARAVMGAAWAAKGGGSTPANGGGGDGCTGRCSNGKCTMAAAAQHCCRAHRATSEEELAAQLEQQQQLEEQQQRHANATAWNAPGGDWHCWQ